MLNKGFQYQTLIRVGVACPKKFVSHATLSHLLNGIASGSAAVARRCNPIQQDAFRCTEVPGGATRLFGMWRNGRDSGYHNSFIHDKWHLGRGGGAVVGGQGQGQGGRRHRGLPVGDVQQVGEVVRCV